MSYDLVCWFGDYYYQCWKQKCCSIFLWKLRNILWILYERHPLFHYKYLTVSFDQFNANIHIDYTLEKVRCVFKCVMYFFSFSKENVVITATSLTGSCKGPSLMSHIQLKSKVYIHQAESAIFVLFYQVRGIIQNACYCLFSTDLNEIFHIKDVYT